MLRFLTALVLLFSTPSVAVHEAGQNSSGVVAPASMRPAGADTPTERPSTVLERDAATVPTVRSEDQGVERPVITSQPDDRIHRTRVDEAVRRFERAGLSLPDVAVEFSDDGCLGNLGLFDRNTTPWRVHVCSDLEFVLTHELAHAWAAANLTDDDREAWVELRGLPAWNDPDLHWRERGTEDAAFVLQQVLMTERPRPMSPVWQERSAAYEQLTGRTPLQLLDAEDAEQRGPGGRATGDRVARTAW